MKDLTGRTAVVTGAASGIGQAMARRFADAGMNVVLADIEQAALTVAVDALTNAGYSAIGIVTDVSSPEANEQLFDAAIDTFGAVNILCLNAGVAPFSPLSDTTPHDWTWCIGVNLLSLGYGIQSFLPHMTAHGDGHVVITASVAGHTSSPGVGVYNASKHAAVTISETLYQELLVAESTVGVTCLCPSIINTQILNSGRNRPESLTDLNRTDPLDGLDDEQLLSAAAIAEAFDAGTNPNDVAELVHDAVINNIFWLFTDDEFAESISRRHASIADRTNPVPSGSLLDLGNG